MAGYQSLAGVGFFHQLGKQSPLTQVPNTTLKMIALIFSPVIFCLFPSILVLKNKLSYFPAEHIICGLELFPVIFFFFLFLLPLLLFPF